MCLNSLRIPASRTFYPARARKGDRAEAKERKREKERGNAGRLDDFQPILAKLPSERWFPRNEVRSPPLAFPHASRKNDFCETLPRPKSFVSHGGDGGRRWSWIKFISQFSRQQKPNRRTAPIERQRCENLCSLILKFLDTVPASTIRIFIHQCRLSQSAWKARYANLIHKAGWKGRGIIHIHTGVACDERLRD